MYIEARQEQIKILKSRARSEGRRARNDDLKGFDEAAKDARTNVSDIKGRIRTLQAELESS